MITRTDSLKSSILLVGAIASLFCWTTTSHAQSEADAIAAITEAKAFRGRVQKDVNGFVTGISLAGISDEQIVSIDFTVFSKLEGITILSGKLTSRSLLHLRKIRNQLRTLELVGCVIDDRELPNLLNEHKSLFWLNLSRTRLSEKSLIAIGNLEELNLLNLSQTNINDAGTKHLGNLKKLAILVLSNTNITDKSMREFTMMTELNSLLIDDTIVTDAGIHELAGLELLNFLGVDRTKVTDRGKESFKKLCPKVVFRLP